MSFESPQSPRDAMEARITALLLGELSAEEEGTLRAALAQDAALAQLHERLSRTLGLVREAAGSLREETTPPAEALRLSAERREKLLQYFKVIPNPALARTNRPSVNWREWAAVAAMLMGLLAVAAIHFVPNFTRARSAGPAAIAAKRGDEIGLEIADASVALQSENLVAGNVTHERWDVSKSSENARNVAPADRFFADGAIAESVSGPQPLRPASVSHGSEIALPQLAQYADGEVDRLSAVDSVALADASPSYAIVATPEKGLGLNFGGVAGQGFSSGGVGGVGGLGGRGSVNKSFAISPGLPVTANAPVTSEPRPTVAFGNEIKSDTKSESEELMAHQVNGAVADKRELMESTLRQKILAVDSAWKAVIPPPPTGAPVVLPPPTPPPVVAGDSTPVQFDSEDFIVRDAGAAQQLANDGLERNWYEGRKTPAPVSTPSPASKPSEPTPSSLTPINGTTPADSKAPELSTIPFAGLAFKRTATGTRQDSIAPPVTEIEKRFGSGAMVTNVALGAVAANEFITPATGLPIAAGQQPLARGRSAGDPATGLPTRVSQDELAEVAREKSLAESEGDLTGYFMKQAAQKELKPNAPAPDRVEMRQKGLAIVLPQGGAKEVDVKSQFQSQTGPVAGKLVQLASSAKAEKKFAELSDLQPAVEQDRLVRRAPELPVPQPEISTADKAFSTFSLNVSDVSFKLAAAALEKGQMPDPATIRSEEFINAFDYRDAEPGGSAPIAFNWERARYPFAHDRDLVRLSVKTAAAGRQPGRPLNLVLLIDNSGSMERADRVRIRKECLRVLAGQLQPQDRVSVVSFAGTARLWVDGLNGSQAGELPQRVGGLTPEGGTNLEAAMQLAYRTAMRHFLASGVNRVVLLTDGAANLGDVQPESLKKTVETHRRQGVALDCFGIGWDGLNDELLEALSRNGDGRYGFVNTPDAAASEFAGQLAGALKVAASDVKVQVEWNPRRVTAYRQIGYAKHQLKKEHFRDNTVDAAEIGAAEAGNALYTVQVNPRGEGPLGTVRVRFKIPSSGDYREHEWPLTYDGNARPLDQSSAALRLAASASAFSEWLVSSPFAGEVTPEKLLGYLSGVPETWHADPRPKTLESMIRQARSVSGR